jgi:hypothetical protein
MASLTLKKSRGAVLVECAITLPLVLSAASFLCLTTGLMAARELLFVDAFLLARAHLYGNARDLCGASQHWPSFPSLAIDVRCDRLGRVSERLLWKGQERAAVSLDLGGAP